MATLPRGGITIPPQHASAWEESRYFIYHTLRANAEALDLAAAAPRALFWYERVGVAAMAQ
jgi:hypothetical protein